MKNTAHVNQLTSRVFPTICNIMKIWHLLDKSTTKKLVQALVLSKVNYCNSLLLGSSQYNIRKLQRLQNMCARIIYRAGKYDHITPFLMELHWLKIEEQIEYKVAVLVYKCVAKTAPTYLQELVISEHGQRLCSTNELKLPVSISKLSQVHDSSFRSMGPRIWNSLPFSLKIANDIKQFKSGLKTYLFTKSYNL